jgi:hypothetical protein
MTDPVDFIFDSENESINTLKYYRLIKENSAPEATSDGCKLGRAGAAAEVGKLEPDLINPLAEQRHGKADAVPGRDRLFLVA